MRGISHAERGLDDQARVLVQRKMAGMALPDNYERVCETYRREIRKLRAEVGSLPNGSTSLSGWVTLGSLATASVAVTVMRFHGMGMREVLVVSALAVCVSLFTTYLTLHIPGTASLGNLFLGFWIAGAVLLVLLFFMRLFPIFAVKPGAFTAFRVLWVPLLPLGVGLQWCGTQRRPVLGSCALAIGYLYLAFSLLLFFRR